MTRDLTPLFEPRSLAIVGVSADPGKWGYWFARDAAKGIHRRRVHLVGRSGGELHGLTVHRSIADLPEPPDLVVLSVPAHALEQAVDESLAAGARALVAIAAGLGELGPEGVERERAIVARVRAAGAVLVGPNCLGVFDAAAELDLASNPLPAGPLGFVSQSGNIALETGLLLGDLGLGFSRLVSVGNQADLDVTEVVANLATHDGTRVIGVYCEDFRDGRAFAETARTAGKPVVLLTVGRTAAAVRAAYSHTGSLTSDLDAVDAACRAAGVHRVDTPRQLVDAVQALLAPQRPSGRRVGVVGDGGGYGAVASDLLGLHDLDLPVLSDLTQSVLRCLAAADRRDREPGRPCRRGRAGHLQLRPRDPHPARGRGARCRALHGVLRWLQRALRRAARAGACGRGRARARSTGDGTPTRRAHDVLGLSPGPRASRRGHPRLPGGRIRGRGPRRARGRRRRTPLADPLAAPGRTCPSTRPATRIPARHSRPRGCRSVRRERCTTETLPSLPPPSSGIPWF